jgi:DNA repair protein RecN (Recombination protein N)
MIVELTVENFAIIDRTQLSLGPGFTVLTGETGAGKSLLVDAIQLALGERADTDQVRAGAAKATVSLVVDLSHNPGLLRRCSELGFEPDEGSLYIQREVFAEGRSQVRIGGRLVPVGALKQLGAALVDLHGQHDHQALLHRETHLGFLDAFGGAGHTELLARVAQAHGLTADARRKLQLLRQGVREREQRLDMLRFQIQEIEAVSPEPGEAASLESALARLKHAEKLGQAVNGAIADLADREDAAMDLLGRAVRSLEDAARLDPELEAAIQPLRDAFYSTQDSVAVLRTYAERLEADPAALDDLARRADQLKRLMRKYGETEALVLQFLAEAKSEEAALADAGMSEADLRAQVERCEAELASACAELTALRLATATRFTAAIRTHLAELAMERAEVQVSIRAREAEADGADDVEFLFTANSGEPPRPLAKIASGGEISRVMLALKSAMAGSAGVPSLIFDEIDSGLSGRAAATMGLKLEALASHYQVVAISHLPQIAGRADQHYRIEKVESGGRTITRVVELRGAEREEEIARMLAGARVTETSLANARELLAK